MSGQVAGIVYMAINSKNGKAYIGQTTRSLEDRIKEHNELNGNCRLLQEAIKKYGVAAFVWSVLATGRRTVKEWEKLEAVLITKHRTFAPFGYNLKINNKHSEESKRKISEGLKRKYREDPEWTAMVRRRVKESTEGTGPKISASLLRFYSNPENRKMLCEGKQKMAQDPEWRRKRKAGAQRMAKNPEWLRKRREAQKRICQDPEYRERQRIKMRALWQNPEYRARQSKSRRKVK